MKRIAALMLALLMTAALLPAAKAAEANDYSVTYSASEVDATSLGAGDYFYVVLSVSEASALWSGLWLLEYPSDFVTPTAASTTFPGNLASLIEETWDNDEAYSDKPGYVTNYAYLGGSGEAPHGEPGVTYSLCGMYVASSEFGGVQMGGPFVRFRYRIDRMPEPSEVIWDENGAYVPFPLVVCESTHLVPGVPIGSPGYCATHDNITVISAKVYFNVPAGSAHTVNFYGYDGHLVSTQQVQDGQAAQAPSVPQFVETSAGAYAFYRWQEDFSCVTGDMEVHADYVLLGDVDYSGSVTSSDALIALRCSAGLVTLDERRVFAADVSGDGAVNSLDALKLSRYVLDLIDTLTY